MRLRLPIAWFAALLVLPALWVTACDDDGISIDPDDVDALIAVLSDTLPNAIGDTLPAGSATTALRVGQEVRVTITPVDEDDDIVIDQDITVTSSNSNLVTARFERDQLGRLLFRLRRIAAGNATITFRHAPTGTTFVLTVTTAPNPATTASRRPWHPGALPARDARWKEGGPPPAALAVATRLAGALRA